MVRGKRFVFAYVCTDSYTERGAMDGFLNKFAPEKIRWVRVFPAKSKPGPKMSSRQVSGSTGSDLVGRMMDRLRKFGDDLLYKECDALALVDDADCRFRKSGDERENYRRWLDDRKRGIEAVLGRSLHFFPILASPEMEAWFVADWEGGFLSRYRRIGDPLRRYINGLLEENEVFLDEIEKFGVFLRGGCSPKLSEKIASKIEEMGMRYSKKDDGPELLGRIRPEEVALRCTMYFGPALREIKSFVDSVQR